MGEAMTADAIRTNLALLESELEFVLTDAGVHKEIQAKIASTGFADCRMFSKADCGGGETGVRSWVKDDLGIDGAGG